MKTKPHKPDKAPEFLKELRRFANTVGLKQFDIYITHKTIHFQRKRGKNKITAKEKSNIKFVANTIAELYGSKALLRCHPRLSHFLSDDIKERIIASNITCHVHFKPIIKLPCCTKRNPIKI